ncbi:hypothetical protein [Mangrovibacterium marinum]|uniref:Uncharacterized protein n=1 Tax=Mangrovibacterium marinum TaxID=1639118 RepID=A0A2T5C2Y3_9BACT|nr:hypothetical protein [Mangrovibacterium marinum]PTN09047.1 hypothetical protein C8N47_106147 [Mangrovibacterium marinum]
MAKLRDLKKDIDFLVGQVVVDCFDYIYNSEKADAEGAYAIIGELLVTRNDLRNRVNHPDGKDNPKLIKQYYRKIAEDLVSACDEGYTKLTKLANA